MAGKRGGRRGGASGISPEDRDLWRYVTRKAEPLAERAKPSREPSPESPVPTADPSPRGDGNRANAKPAVRPPPPPPPKPLAPELAHGTVAGLDKRSAARLKRGKLPIGARLDLHGATRAEAERELRNFLARAQDRGERCVLVITGKGTTKEAAGVLRAQVPKWLNQAPNRERILAFDHARPEHGGLGALYILLRRKRA
ncbi:MAG: Smr/MutS family protein [Kiloniellaceae bacterium]